MSRRAAYTQAEIERAARALKAVGETVTGVEHLPNGGFKVLTAANTPQKPLSALEAWELENGHRAA